MEFEGGLLIDQIGPMTDNLEIRKSVTADLKALEDLYPAAFPDEDLLPLVRDLLQNAPIVSSLVGVMGSSLIGHIVFTECSLPDSDAKVALLGPLAVAPAFQRQGVGSALIRSGFQDQESVGTTGIYVLGNPAYYGRFGFKKELDVTPPYPMPAEWHGAWQSISLTNAGGPCRGQLSVPEPWRKPALWSD